MRSGSYKQLKRWQPCACRQRRGDHFINAPCVRRPLGHVGFAQLCCGRRRRESGRGRAARQWCWIAWRARRWGKGDWRQRFSKVLYIVALYSKYTRALTFETLCQAVRHAGRLLAARAGAKKSRERHVRTVAGSHIGWHLSTMVVRCAYLGVIAAGREHLCRAAMAVLARTRHATRVSATHVMQAVLRMSAARREFVGAVAAARVLVARVRRAPVRGTYVAVVGATAAIRRCVKWLCFGGKGYVCWRMHAYARGTTRTHRNRPQNTQQHTTRRCF